MDLRLVVALALAVACTWGCGGGDDPGWGPGHQFIDSDCDPGVGICDVNKPACQERIWRATACQRSQKPGDLPPIRSITSEEFGEELQTERGPAPPPSAWDITLGLLGLLNPDSNSGDDTVDALVDGVLGFYDRRTRVVTLLSDATGLSDESKVLVLSHEFVHVLQDRSAGFELLGNARTTDTLLANDALTEGEATVHSNIALAVGRGDGADALDWERYFGGMFEGVFAAMDRSRAPYLDALLQLPYPLGGEPVLDAWLLDGQHAVNALYTTDRMLSAADWMRPYPEGFESPRPQLDCLAPMAPEGHSLVGQDVLGVAGLTALWSAQGADAATGWAQGDRWRGGMTWVFGAGDEPAASPDSAVLVWHTRWASEAAARELETLLAGTDVFVRVRERSVVLAVADDPTLLTWAEDQADTWLDCDQTKRKRLPEPMRPFRRPDPRQYTLRAHLPAGR